MSTHSTSIVKSTDILFPTSKAWQTPQHIVKKHNTDSYQHVFKYTGLLGGVQAFHILVSIIRNKVAAVCIGEAGLGLADLYSRSIELIANATNLGVAFSAVRQLSLHYETGNRREQEACVHTIRSFALLTALLGVFVCLLSAYPLSRYVLGDTSYVGSLLLLSPAVAFATLTGGEMAILKGMRCLKQIAANAAMGALATLLICVPLYWVWGMSSIVAVLVLTSASVCAIHLRASTQLFSYRISPFHRATLQKGAPLIKLGIAYVMAGVMASGAEMLIRSSIVSSQGGLVMSGLYAAGLTLTVSYARLIFVAMDADYFPRLSSSINDGERTKAIVNRQIDVLTMLMTPFLILFALFLPLVVRLLYTESFLPVVPMVLCALPYMFFKAVYTPIAYLSLATGASRIYMTMELIYDVVLAVSVVVGYQQGGLIGAGVGLSLANASDMLLLYIVYRRKFGFRFSRTTLCGIAVHGLLLFSALWAIAHGDAVTRYLCSGVALLLSLAYSWRLLQSEMAINTKIKQWLHRRNKK